jgi:hypothetical protein
MTTSKQTNPSTLFQLLAEPDRSKTQIYYGANYLLSPLLCDASRSLICWRKKAVLRKQTIEAMLTEDMTKLRFAPASKGRSDEQLWQIHWVYNAIPTQLEWEKKSATFLITVEFRVLVDGHKIVLLDFVQ